MLSSMVTSLRLVQPQNRLWVFPRQFLGILIEVRPLQSWNTP